MRVLFFGTSAFALPTLNALHESSRHEIIAVVTQPDRPSGRGMKGSVSPVKARAQELGYTVHQPERVRRKPFPALVAEMKPDALVVISFGQIIPQVMLEMPRYGGINVHGSLLPRWRGAAPIHHAILAGDTETGVATMQMEATLDTGPTYLVAPEPISPSDTVGSLEPRLALLGGPLLVETLDRLEAGNLTPTPQPYLGMTYASPVEKEAGFLDPLTTDAAGLARQVRGTFPRPGASLVIGDKGLKVLEAHVIDTLPDAAPGTVAQIRKEGIALATLSGTLLLTRVQPQNKGAMSAGDFARGARLTPGTPATRPAG